MDRSINFFLTLLIHFSSLTRTIHSTKNPFCCISHNLLYSPPGFLISFLRVPDSAIVPLCTKIPKITQILFTALCNPHTNPGTWTILLPNPKKPPSPTSTIAATGPGQSLLASTASFKFWASDIFVSVPRHSDQKPPMSRV